MTKDEELGKARFERAWRPLIVFAILLGFAAQSLLPYISPITMLVFSVSGGALYWCAYENFVGGAPSTGMKSIIEMLLASTCMAALIVGGGQVITSLRILSEPCHRMRTELMKKPSGDVADSYSALHCPAYFSIWPPG
jgi:hypothetical protein